MFEYWLRWGYGQPPSKRPKRSTKTGTNYFEDPPSDTAPPRRSGHDQESFKLSDVGDDATDSDDSGEDNDDNVQDGNNRKQKKQNPSVRPKASESAQRSTTEPLGSTAPNGASDIRMQYTTDAGRPTSNTDIDAITGRSPPLTNQTRMFREHAYFVKLLITASFKLS